MLKNPFTPSIIVSDPGEFFGRGAELNTLARALQLGSVAIYGGVGIGKSSLLARLLRHIADYVPNARCDYLSVVGNATVKTVDDAAKIVLEELAYADTTTRKLKIGLKLFEYESAASYAHFVSGRHLAALTRLFEEGPFGKQLRSVDYLVLAIDEADKCPRALAQLVRAVSTKTQLQGITNLRFVLAGVSPFFDEILAEDEGVVRTFHTHIPLGQLTEEEGAELLRAKLGALASSAEEQRVPLRIDPAIEKMILRLSGLHPHLIQLLGSYIVEQECDDPDNVLDAKDLVGALRVICYEARGAVYDRMLHTLEMEGKLEAFSQLIAVASPGLPTCIGRAAAQKRLSNDELEWLRAHQVIARANDEYRLVDEFFRIRLILDGAETDEAAFEQELLEATTLEELDDVDEDEV